MIIRITGSGFVKTGAITDGTLVEFRHWQEVVGEADEAIESAADQETEEAVVELWLEDPMSFQSNGDDEDMSSVTGPLRGAIRRADNFGRTKQAAAAQNWDREFAEAQAHAASVLKNLGNGR